MTPPRPPTRAMWCDTHDSEYAEARHACEQIAMNYEDWKKDNAAECLDVRELIERGSEARACAEELEALIEAILILKPGESYGLAPGSEEMKALRAMLARWRGER